MPGTHDGESDHQATAEVARHVRGVGRDQSRVRARLLLVLTDAVEELDGVLRRHRLLEEVDAGQQAQKDEGRTLRPMANVVLRMTSFVQNHAEVAREHIDRVRERVEVIAAAQKWNR